MAVTDLVSASTRDLPVLFSNEYARAVTISYEYERNCDPILSLVSFSAPGLGKPLSKSKLDPGSLSLRVNGERYTWHGAMVRYEFGIEFAIGLTNEIYEALTDKELHSLSFVSIDNYETEIPVAQLAETAAAAFDACSKKVRGR